MSQIKKQLLDLFPELSDGAKCLKDESARKRWYAIRYIAQSRFSVKRACAQVNVSDDYFRKWAKRLLKTRSLAALTDQSRRPIRQPRRIRKRWESRIIATRQLNPYEGCERISERVFDDWGRRIAPSTVNKVLGRHGLISRKASKKLIKKHLKRYRRPLPGYLQMDFKYVPYKVNGEQYYQLSCVDHHSSWRMIRIYDSKDLGAVENFLFELESNCPFPVMQIQTDNDLAFTHKFWRLRMGFDPTFEHPLSVWCRENGAENKLIPVGEKELNGKVENTHKQDDREFFSQINPQNLTHLQMLSRAYEKRWNESRKTRALGWLTPNQTLERAYVWAVLLYRLQQEKISEDQIKLPIRYRRKRKSYNDRYLEWLEKDAKKYGT
jgi:hypothetical protein